MNIHKVKSIEDKEDQHWEIICGCIKHWYMVNNNNYPHYTDIMNMKTYRRNKEHYCLVYLTNHLNLNKW